MYFSVSTDRGLHWSAATLEPSVLDPDTCTCCPTSLARTDSGGIGAYRGHTPEDIRDISLVQHIAGHWSEPHIPNADNWHFHGCPVNGPKLDAEGSTVALTWFTAASQGPKVQFPSTQPANGPSTRRQFNRPFRVGRQRFTQPHANRVSRAFTAACQIVERRALSSQQRLPIVVETREPRPNLPVPLACTTEVVQGVY